MAEWLVSEGVAATRAILVQQGQIIRHLYAGYDDGVAAGTIAKARLSRVEGTANVVTLDSGEEALLQFIPPGISIGATMLVEISRCSIPERDLVKRALCRPAAPDAEPQDAPGIREQMAATGHPVRDIFDHMPDALAEAGWGELCDAAQSGLWPFPGGVLRCTLTPAMTVIDVDGEGPAAALAQAGARAAAAMLLVMDIGGNIVIDLPTMDGKAERIAAAQTFDAVMTGPFERTAVNGYGLMQIIRRRRTCSLPERWQFTPVQQHASALIDTATRQAATRPGAAVTITAAPAVAAWINARPVLMERMARRTGSPIDLQADARCGIAHGYVR